MKGFLKAMKRTWKSERGITGLETAIILIAFVVVASVFAYTVLSAGIFSSQKGKEAINAGIESARSAMTLVGSTVAQDTDSDGTTDNVVFVVSNAIDGQAIDWTETADADADGILSDEASQTHVVNISYMNQGERVADIAWTKTQIGKGDGDDLLEPGEKFEITVDLSALSPGLTQNTNFTIEVAPPKGSTLIINRTTPGVIDAVMDLK